MHKGGLKQRGSWAMDPDQCSWESDAHCPSKRAPGSAFCATHKALLAGRRPAVVVEQKPRVQDTKHGAG